VPGLQGPLGQVLLPAAPAGRGLVARLRAGEGQAVIPRAGLAMLRALGLTILALIGMVGILVNTWAALLVAAAALGLAYGLLRRWTS
jgi:hypothetical protein